MSSAPPKKSSARTWLKGLGIGFLSILGLVILLVVIAYAYLSSAAGGEKLRSIALDKVNQSIQGQLTVDRLAFGGNRLLLHGVTLKDPDGDPVATIEVLEVKVALLALLRRTAEVTSLRIVGPRLLLRSDQGGMNLIRAIESRHPQPVAALAKPESNPSRLILKVLLLELSRGSFTFVQSTDQGEREISLEELHARGSLEYQGSSGNLAADLDLEGRGRVSEKFVSASERAPQPVSGPVHVAVHAKMAGSSGRATAAIEFPGLQLDALASRSGGDNLTVTVNQSKVSPELLRVFVPSYPLRTGISLDGEGGQQGSVVAAKLRLRVGPASVLIDGSFNTARLHSDGITVRARDIHLDQLLEKGPPSNFSLDLHAEGGGTSISDLHGKVVLEIPVVNAGSQRFGPIHLSGQAKNGVFEFSELLAVLPGAKLAASGTGNPTRVNLSGKLTAVDLQILSRAIGALTGGPPLHLSGAGELQFSAKGKPPHLSIAVEGHFPALAYEGYRIGGLALSATLPDAQRPLEAQASIRAESLQIGTRTFENVAAEMATRDREFTLSLTSARFTDLVLRAQGIFDPDNQGLLLSSLLIRYPEGEWTLQKPSRIRFDNQRTQVESLQLRSGNQSVFLDGGLLHGKLKLAVEVASLELRQLPRAFVDPNLNLAGQLSLRASAQGLIAHPDVQATLDLRNAQVKDWKNLSLALKGRYEKDRAAGNLTASALGAGIKADFDFFPQALLQHKPKPLRVLLEMDKVDLAEAVRAAGRTEPLTGTVASRIELTGMADSPHLKAEITGKSVQFDQSPPIDFQLNTGSDLKGALGINLQAQVQGSQTALAVRTPWTLSGVLKHPPDRAELIRTPVELDLEVKQLPLELANQLGLVDQDIQGRLSLTLQAKGTPRAPHGKAKLSVAGLSVGSFFPTDLTMLATASSQGLDTSMTILRQESKLLDATISLKGDPGRLGSLDAVAAAPLSMKVALGPVRLEDLIAIAGPIQESSGPPLQGLILGELTLSGTLNSPTIKLQTELEKATSGSQSLGKAQLGYSYANSESALSAALTSSAGGVMRIEGGGRLELGFAALRKGLDFRAAPVHFTLQADQFNLAFLSGILPQVLTISGPLRANASLSGTVGVPSLHGELEWTNGELALEFYGGYQKIHLLATGDTQHLEIKDLSAVSNGGTLKLSAQATRAGNGMTLSAKAELHKFPIVSEDQLVATITLRNDIQGQITPDAVSIPRLSVASAQIELPDKAPKSLQSLDRPSDIVLITDAKTRKKRLVRSPAAATAEGTGGGSHSGTSPPRQISIVVDAPRNLWVRGKDLNVEVGLAQGFHIEYTDKPLIFGTITLIRGRVDVLGRRFDVQKDSELRFGGNPTKPYLNVTALHTNDAEHVKVYLSVQGQGADVTIKPSSEPPLSESEIYTLIATGRRTLKTRSGAAATPGSQATSIVGSVVASELKKTLASKLPLDVLSIEAGEGGLSGTKLEAGTYLGDKFYVGYTGRYGADPYRGENTNAVRLEYQFTRGWHIEAEYGDAKAGSMDLVWTKDY